MRPDGLRHVHMCVPNRVCNDGVCLVTRRRAQYQANVILPAIA